MRTWLGDDDDYDIIDNSFLPLPGFGCAQRKRAATTDDPPDPDDDDYSVPAFDD